MLEINTKYHFQLYNNKIHSIYIKESVYYIYRYWVNSHGFCGRNLDFLSSLFCLHVFCIDHKIQVFYSSIPNHEKRYVRVKTDIGKMNFFIKIRNIVAYDEKIYFKSRTKRLQFNSLEVFQNADDALQEHWFYQKQTNMISLPSLQDVTSPIKSRNRNKHKGKY